MKRNRLVYTCTIVALAALMVDGCSASATKGTGSGSAPTQNQGAGAVHLTGYSNNDGPTSSAILTGAIGDFGKAVSVYPSGAIDPEHNADLNLALTQGSFRVSIVGLDKEIVSAISHLRVNTSTCSGNASVTGVAPVVAGSGTGAYKGITGSFSLTFAIDEIVPKSPCNLSAAFLAQAIVITGWGTVSLA